MDFKRKSILSLLGTRLIGAMGFDRMKTRAERPKPDIQPKVTIQESRRNYNRGQARANRGQKTPPKIISRKYPAHPGVQEPRRTPPTKKALSHLPGRAFRLS